MIKYLLLILIAVSFLFFKLERDDHSDIPGLDSTNLHAGLYLPKGFTATVWAESPQFYNPTNMDVDAKGRVWVTEAVNYRNYNNDSTKFIHHAKGDRVMILEDTDGDGKSDHSKVFVEDKDLVSPLGIAVIGNKVIVSCAPSIIVYTDNDGDDKPDSKEIFLTGFGGKDHDHSLHSLVAGPDGKWYFNVGNAGPHEVKDKAGWNLRSGSLYTGGSPYNKENTGGQKSDDGKIWVGGLAMRIGEDGKGLEVMAHNFRNAYELALDSYGNMWQSDNDDQVVTCRTSYVMEGGNAGYFSADGNRYWQADQRPRQSTFTAHWHQEDPGVMPAGDNTGAGSPTGMVVYEGDAFGNQYRGMLLSCEAGKNVIYGYKPKPKGAGFELKRKNFISTLKTVDDNYKWDEKVTSESKWFRPSDISVGTDGALYIADWYDPVVGGHKMDDQKGFGRIYRITPTGKNLKLPSINLNTVNGQIQALLNPAINVRNAGFVALKAQGTQVIDRVRDLLKSTNVFHRARAVWLLAQLGESGKAEVKLLLNDKDAAIRLTAFRALKQNKAAIPELLKIAVNDTSAAVRREVAIALRDLPAAESTQLIVSLAAGFDGNDPWYLNALGIAATGKEDLVYAAIKKTIGNDDPLQWSNKFAKIAWRIHPATAIKDLTVRARSPKISKEERKRAITALAFINTTKSVESMLELQNSALADVKENAGYWINFRRSNEWFSLYNWSKISEKKDIDSKTSKELDKLQANLEKTGSHEATGNKTLSIAEINKLAGDVKKGRVIFNTKCAICHKVGDFGKTIGPDLTNINKKYDKVSLLDAIINPSAAIVFGYEPWVVTMKDETVVSGFILSQGNTLVIKDLAGKQHVLDVQKMKEKKQLTSSIMPDPRGLALSKSDLADISAYLMNLGKSKR